MTYPILKIEDPSLLKITTTDDVIKNITYQTGKHYHESLLKSLRIDNEYFKKKYKSLNKKILIFISEILIREGSTVIFSTLAILNPSAGFHISSSTALLTRIVS